MNFLDLSILVRWKYAAMIFWNWENVKVSKHGITDLF